MSKRQATAKAVSPPNPLKVQEGDPHPDSEDGRQKEKKKEGKTSKKTATKEHRTTAPDHDGGSQKASQGSGRYDESKDFSTESKITRTVKQTSKESDYSRTYSLSELEDEPSSGSDRKIRKSKKNKARRSPVELGNHSDLDTIVEDEEEEECQKSESSSSKSTGSKSATDEDDNDSKSSAESMEVSQPPDEETIVTRIDQNLQYERLKFEMTVAENDQQAAQNLDFRALAISAFNRLLKEDPTRRVVAFIESDDTKFPKLKRLDQMPRKTEEALKYIADPRFNEKTKRLVFFTRFQTSKPLNEIKRTSNIMEWLNASGTWIKVLHLKTTQNVRGGFFIGKSSRITNLSAMTLFVKARLQNKFKKVSDFQLNYDTIGMSTDKSTKAKALVLECAKSDFQQLSAQLLQTFPMESTFPFMPFHVMGSLDKRSQKIYYKSHKLRTTGNSIVEVVIPAFHSLDTNVQVNLGASATSLRHFVFDLSQQGRKMKIDIDDGTRTGETVILVNSENKTEAMELIQRWLDKHFEFKVSWEESMMYHSSTFNLSPEARTVATKYANVAADLLKDFPSLPTPQSAKQGKELQRKSKPKNTWVDIAKLTPLMNNAVRGDNTGNDDNRTATTTSSTRATMAPDFHILRKNITKVAVHHKQLEAKIIENFLDDQRQYEDLLITINDFRSRLDNLDIAHQRQAIINQAQL